MTDQTATDDEKYRLKDDGTLTMVGQPDDEDTMEMEFDA